MEEETIKAVNEGHEFFENILKGKLDLDFKQINPLLQSQSNDIGNKYPRYAFETIEFEFRGIHTGAYTQRHLVAITSVYALLKMSLFILAPTNVTSSTRF